MVEGSVLTPPLYAQISSSYSGTYTQITSTNSGSGTGGSGYMVFSGLTNDAILIRLQNLGYNAGVSGFQIIPVGGPKLTSATASPTSLARGQGILITAAVTPGDNAISSVTINASAVGGASSLALVANGAGSYTNTVVVSPATALGNQTLTVNATDSQSFVVSSSLVVTVVAANEVWNGAGSDNKWSTGANWVSGVQPGTGDSATLAGSTQLTGNLDSSFNLASLTFNNNAGSFIITNTASTLTLAGGLTNNSANVQTLAVPVALSGGQTINAAAGNVVISQPVSGSGAGITLVGNGTLTLSGANTYTGNTTISAGELVGQTGGSCANSAVTVAAGATNGVKVAAANGQWSCAGLTYNSGTTYADFDFGNFTPSSTTAPLNVGALTANNTVKVLLRNVTIPATVGKYPLIHYTGNDPLVSSFSLNSALPLVANAAGGLVVDTANKNVAVGVQLIVPNLTFNNAPGVARIVTMSDLIAAGLASAQSSPQYTVTVGTPANGGAAFTNSAGTMMKYTNSASFSGASDSFSYTVSDGVSSATATVSINMASVAGMQLTPGTDGNHHPVISYHGLPGYSYHIQRATTLSPADWTNVQAVTCDSNGYATWTDSSVDTTQSTVYYRLSYP